MQSGKVRRARLYYLRGLTGNAARIKGEKSSDDDAAPARAAPRPPRRAAADVDTSKPPRSAAATGRSRWIGRPVAGPPGGEPGGGRSSRRQVCESSRATGAGRKASSTSSPTTRGTCVFVEVRSRTGEDHGHALETITPAASARASCARRASIWTRRRRGRRLSLRRRRASRSATTGGSPTSSTSRTRSKSARLTRANRSDAGRRAARIRRPAWVKKSRQTHIALAHEAADRTSDQVQANPLRQRLSAGALFGVAPSRRPRSPRWTRELGGAERAGAGSHTHLSGPASADPSRRRAEGRCGSGTPAPATTRAQSEPLLPPDRGWCRARRDDRRAGPRRLPPIREHHQRPVQ